MAAASGGGAMAAIELIRAGGRTDLTDVEGKTAGQCVKRGGTPTMHALSLSLYLSLSLLMNACTVHKRKVQNFGTPCRLTSRTHVNASTCHPE